MNIKEFSQSKQFRTILVILAGLVFLMAAFSLGENVGFHKASFTFQNGNNFYNAFGPRNSGMTPDGEFSDAHGAVGRVVSITLPTLTIEDKDNTEKNVLISSQTIIRQFRDTLQPSDIKVGDYVVAIGEPNAQSQIAATLIRELPPPPSASDAATPATITTASDAATPAQ
jgi:hypothetical protein